MKRIEILGERDLIEIEIVLSKDCPNYPIKDPFEFMSIFEEVFAVNTEERIAEGSVESDSNWEENGWHVVLRVPKHKKQKLLDFIESFNNSK